MQKSLLVPLCLLAVAPCLAHVPSNLGTFTEPAANVRPRFQYWLPDASVDSEVVVRDIAGAAQVGGIEFVPFFEYGGMPPTNWSTYNFRTPPFVNISKAALNTHAEHGLVMDFALGPNQGQGVPAEVDNKGLQWDMVSRSNLVVLDPVSLLTSYTRYRSPRRNLQVADSKGNSWMVNR
ncbi:hypothetical protein BDV12DRAFT_195159 [Aspergillus spectabilis]